MIGHVRCTQSVRTLSQTDLDTMLSSGLEILTPTNRSPHSQPTWYPTFHGRASNGRSVHVHFEWLGSDPNSGAVRAHWTDLIDLFVELGEDDWLQPIIQTVDLSDSCAIALAPAIDIVDDLTNRPSSLVDLAKRSLDVARLLLAVEQSHVRLLRLDATDVVVTESGETRISARCELARTTLNRRTEYASSQALFARWIGDLATTIPTLGTHCAVLSGIQNGLVEGNDPTAGIGNLIIALEDLVRSQIRTDIRADETCDSVWQRPERKHGKPRHGLIYLVVAVIACVGVAYAFELGFRSDPDNNDVQASNNGVGASGKAQNWSMGQMSTVQTSDGVLTQAAFAGQLAAAGDTTTTGNPTTEAGAHGGKTVEGAGEAQLAAAGNTQDAIPQVVSELITQRLALLERVPQSVPDSDYYQVFVMGSEALSAEKARAGYIASAGVNIAQTKLLSLKVTGQEPPTANELSVAIAYEFKYSVTSSAGSEQMRESEELELGLRMVAGEYRIFSALPIDNTGTR